MNTEVLLFVNIVTFLRLLLMVKESAHALGDVMVNGCDGIAGVMSGGDCLY